MKKQELTEIQKKILEILKSYIAKHSIPPTIKEISTLCGLSSTSSVHHQLSCLEEKGYIVRDKTKSRSIKLTGKRISSKKTSTKDVKKKDTKKKNNFETTKLNEISIDENIYIPQPIDKSFDIPVIESPVLNNKYNIEEVPSSELTEELPEILPDTDSAPTVEDLAEYAGDFDFDNLYKDYPDQSEAEEDEESEPLESMIEMGLPKGAKFEDIVKKDEPKPLELILSNKTIVEEEQIEEETIPEPVVEEVVPVVEEEQIEEETTSEPVVEEVVPVIEEEQLEEEIISEPVIEEEQLEEETTSEPVVEEVVPVVEEEQLEEETTSEPVVEEVAPVIEEEKLEEEIISEPVLEEVEPVIEEEEPIDEIISEPVVEEVAPVIEEEEPIDEIISEPAIEEVVPVVEEEQIEEEIISEPVIEEEQLEEEVIPEPVIEEEQLEEEVISEPVLEEEQLEEEIISEPVIEEERLEEEVISEPVVEEEQLEEEVISEPVVEEEQLEEEVISEPVLEEVAENLEVESMADNKEESKLCEYTFAGFDKDLSPISRDIFYMPSEFTGVYDSMLYEVNTDELENFGIYNGDIILIEYNSDPKNDDIVFAVYDGQILIKQVKFLSHVAILSSGNKNNNISADRSNIVFIGVVKGLFRTAFTEENKTEENKQYPLIKYVNKSIEIATYYKLPPRLLGVSEAFLFAFDNDEMGHFNILNGDFGIFEYMDNPNDGDLALLLVDDKMILRIVTVKDNENYVLVSGSSSIPDIEIKQGNLVCFGRFKGLFRKF